MISEQQTALNSFNRFPTRREWLSRFVEFPFEGKFLGNFLSKLKFCLMKTWKQITVLLKLTRFISF